MQPEHARLLLTTVFLPGLHQEHRTTRQVIEAIPADKGDYRPDEIARTSLDLAWHIVATELGFLTAVSQSSFDIPPRPRPETLKTSADVSHYYAEHFELLYQSILQLTDEDLTKTLDFRGLFQLPAVLYLNFAIVHSIHHRGQLSTYLRPMGAKVPNIYGESYDSSKAKRA